MNELQSSKPLIDATLKTKEKALFDNMVYTVTSVNESGVFDILPFHTNFITLISKYVIFDRGLSSERKFDLEKGVLYVMSNKVDVYIGI